MASMCTSAHSTDMATGLDAAIAANSIGGIVEEESDGGNSIEISGNTIQYVGGDGVYVGVYDLAGDDHSLAINDNMIQYVDDDGIDVYFGSGYGYGYGYYAAIAANANAGIGEEESGGGNSVEINGNTIQDVGGDAVHVDFYGSGGEGGHSLAINDNMIQYIGDDGIDVYFGYGYGYGYGYDYGYEVAIAANASRGIGEEESSGGNSVEVTGNTIEDVSGTGVYFYSYYTYRDTDVTVSDNTIRNVGGDGIDFDSYYYNGHDVGNSLEIVGNQISNVEGSGIDVYFYADFYDTNVAISDNTIEKRLRWRWNLRLHGKRRTRSGQLADGQRQHGDERR